MSYGAGGIAIFLILFWVAGIALLVWALVLWLVVGHRWLRLHPAPSRGGAISMRPTDATADPVEDPRHHFGPDLRAWAAANESPTALAQRLGISGAAAAQIGELARRAAAGQASDADWVQLQPWLPKLLGRD